MQASTRAVKPSAPPTSPLNRRKPALRNFSGPSAARPCSDHGRALFRPKPINAKNCAVADLADRLRSQPPSDPSSIRTTWLGPCARALISATRLVTGSLRQMRYSWTAGKARKASTPASGKSGKRGSTFPARKPRRSIARRCGGRLRRRRRLFWSARSKPRRSRATSRIRPPR